MIVVRDWDTEHRFTSGESFRTVATSEHGAQLEVLDADGTVIGAFSHWSSVQRGDAPIITTKAFDEFVAAHSRAALLAATEPGASP